MYVIGSNTEWHELIIIIIHQKIIVQISEIVSGKQSETDCGEKPIAWKRSGLIIIEVLFSSLEDLTAKKRGF